MIQRIQSLFLLLALVALGLLFFIPFATSLVPGAPVVAGYATPLILMQLITLAVVLVALLMFKKRMLQIRLCIFNIIALLGYQGIAVYLALQPGYAMHWVMPMPVVAAILCLLALRGIAKDEALIRSIDRLR